MAKNLFVVSTPIGNLKDITLRALETLKKVDLILCEDTRRTKRLLSYFHIKTPVLSYHQHSKPRKVVYILDLLGQGKDLALVTDAGTPGISDPGNQLIAQIVKQLDEQIFIVSVPGPCALISTLSISGFKTDRFIFLGFIPQRKKRKKFLEKIINSQETVVFYESPYRIIKTLSELNNFEKFKNREIIVARELTKKFETIYRGKIEEVIKKIKKEPVKGEFVVAVSALK